MLINALAAILAVAIGSTAWSHHRARRDLADFLAVYWSGRKSDDIAEHFGSETRNAAARIFLAVVGEWRRSARLIGLHNFLALMSLSDRMHRAAAAEIARHRLSTLCLGLDIIAIAAIAAALWQPDAIPLAALAVMIRMTHRAAADAMLAELTASANDIVTTLARQAEIAAASAQ